MRHRLTEALTYKFFGDAARAWWCWWGKERRKEKNSNVAKTTFFSSYILVCWYTWNCLSKEFPMQRTIINHSEDIPQLMDCSANYLLTWKGGESGKQMKDFLLSISPSEQNDPLEATGILTSRSTKFNVFK